MTTGEKIRTRRKQLGMSVDALAKKVGKNRATIYRYENDEIEMPASMLQPLANALDTSPDELMDWKFILRDFTEHNKEMDKILSQLEDGVSTEGLTYRYIERRTNFLRDPGQPGPRQVLPDHPLVSAGGLEPKGD